jgi:hypothetical protein
MFTDLNSGATTDAPPSRGVQRHVSRNFTGGWMTDACASIGSICGPALIGILMFGFVGAAITFLVYTIIALVRVDYYEQKDYCKDSNAWVFVLVHLLVGGNLSASSAKQGGDQSEAAGCAEILNSLIFCGLLAWGIYEVWGVDCFNDMDNTTLWVITQVYVIVDIIAIGIALVGGIIATLLAL